MTKEQKEALKRQIRERIEVVTGDISAFKEGAAPVSPDSAIGRLTRMEAINSKSISEAALRTSRSRLALLEKALREIDTDDFGLCQHCEEPIAFARLMAMPEAVLCIDCAARQEN